ncbi:MAG: FGGY-family carbohydrate kinase [Candidatus Thorarchaeota archaeon]|jgi:autoinducer 2 (AI-2) kinase
MVVAAIDAGTTGVRCMIVDKSGTALSISRRNWDYKTHEFLEIAKEFDTALFWTTICTVVRESLDDSAVDASKVEAVATTSQRHGIVLLDSDGAELHGGPNIDARGAMTQYLIEDTLSEKFHDITGCWPPLMFGPARVAWFEEEEPEVFEAISHVLPINDWVTFRLSGEFSSEPASASATGFFDIKEMKWSTEVAKAIGIDEGVFPKLMQAGEIVGEVTSKAAKDTGLSKGVPVVQGGTDTHCALLAAKSTTGDITAIMGSTAPIMLVMDKPVLATDQKMWTGCHLIPGLWTMESNATMTGAYLDWAIDLLCQQSESPTGCRERVYSDMKTILSDVPPGSHETYAGLGPSVMDCRTISDIPQARLFFPQPALPQVIPLSSASLIHAVLENIAYSVRGNVEQLEQVRKANNVRAAGGMTRSKTWLKILANVLDRPVQVPTEPEGSLLGAAICAAKGVGWFDSFEAGVEEMVSWQAPFEPDERAKEYDSYYKRWTEIWCGAE